MAERPLAGRRILVVEDNYLVASELSDALQRNGAEVVGPARSLDRGLAIAETTPPDAAVLDINLRGDPVYELVDVLVARGVRVVFATGYDSSVVPARYADIPRCNKPVDVDLLMRYLVA